jgi:hypothetical protein
MLILLFPYFVSLLCPSFIQLAIGAVQVNRTLDDTVQDPTTHESVTYDPSSAWNANGFCGNGPKCYISPDKTRLTNGTWHESTVSFWRFTHTMLPVHVSSSMLNQAA